MSYSFKAMNTKFNVYELETLVGQKVESWCYLVEKTLSRFLPTSELSQLNSLNGRLFLPSKMLYEAVKQPLTITMRQTGFSTHFCITLFKL
ncbi:hypothetical protein AAAC51_30385 [Priestia megaterium]